MNFPENVYYTKNHEWVRVDGEFAYVGITEFAQSELGDIVYLEIETVDEQLNASDAFGTVEAVKTVSDIYMPVAGQVIEVNPKLEDNPEIVNEDAFGEGWLIKIKISDMTELDQLLKADAYKELAGVA